ncbi:uncharacterized protein CC84DRAFT_1244885 [Paraphaeosphaeria sporulosa]|uniref:Uncharacterized protein n=1 Tax=Paraphaeosphaeria sporulosa TaxID=1460663 RepID=A0A177CF93_9PLEO|nr:uncharacterized protein CC84DRAFT_1244885 [Paraphaeosphaeria sporulosa]OAG06006.1 hypothetical protein CC84DRAFT_1244885 [Paraphaeosphaeria sporulosa]
MDAASHLKIIFRLMSPLRSTAEPPKSASQGTDSAGKTYVPCRDASKTGNGELTSSNTLGSKRSAFCNSVFWKPRSSLRCTSMKDASRSRRWRLTSSIRSCWSSARLRDENSAKIRRGDEAMAGPCFVMRQIRSYRSIIQPFGMAMMIMIRMTSKAKMSRGTH